MANPNVPQGTINRLRASVTIPNHPELNVTAAFLGKEGMSLAPEGNSVTYIDTMTGAVTSPEPYMRITVTVHLLKTQAISDLYKKQMEALSTIGDLTVRPDATPLSPYQVINASIQSVRELNFSGADAGFVITLGGFYNINQNLWG